MQFRKKTKQNNAVIDITALIDVIFLLLIFFMISTTFINATGIKIELPTTTAKPAAGKPQTLEVAISAQHEIYFSGKQIRRNQLKNALIEARKKSDQSSLVIRADGNAQHKVVVFVMDTARQAGLNKFSIATRQEKEK